MTQQIKSAIRMGAASACHHAGLYKWLHRGKVILLMYHRVLTDAERVRRFVQPGMYVTPAVFEKQMAFLKAHYTVLSLSRLLDHWQQDDLDDAQRYAVITFDDGWQDNYRNAWPILRAHQMPATLFLPTAYVATNRWFWTDRLAGLIGPGADPDQQQELNRLLAPFRVRLPRPRSGFAFSSDQIDVVIESLKTAPVEAVETLLNRLSSVLCRPDPSESDERLFLNWAEVQEMSQQGVSFGAHSHSNQILTGLNPDEIQHELATPIRLLREKQINPLPVFCYPNGNSTARIRAWVKEAGYQAAIGGVGIENRVPFDLFNLRRIGIHNDMSATLPLFSFCMLDIKRRRSDA